MLSTTAVRAFSAQAFFLAERSGWLRMAEYEQLVTVVKSELGHSLPEFGAQFSVPRVVRPDLLPALSLRTSPPRSRLGWFSLLLQAMGITPRLSRRNSRKQPFCSLLSALPISVFALRPRRPNSAV